MKTILMLVLFIGFLFVPFVNAYPPNPKNCCVYCPHDSQELCFWNDNNFLYMSIEPYSIGSFCADVMVDQNSLQYNVKGYNELDDFICREIDAYLETRFADGIHESSSPFDPTRSLTITIENCEAYWENLVLKYPSACGDVPTTTSTMAQTSTTTTIQITTTMLPTTTITTTTIQITTTSTLPTTTITTTTTIPPQTSTTTSLPTTTTTILPKMHSISGFITGDVIADVSVKLTGKAAKTITTNEAGYYKFSGLESGYYTIIPQCEECDFEPHNYPVQNLMSDLYNMDFISTFFKAPPCPPTAICGEDPEEIELLRYLRDNVLRETKEGQELIKQWKKVKGIKKSEENDRKSVADD